METQIFGRTVRVKQFGCDQLGIPGERAAPSVTIFVKVTNSCNINCPFCSNACSHDPNAKFNVPKLFAIIRECLNNNIIVNRVCITGGEPSLVPHLVKSILDEASGNTFNNIHLHLNTNGLFRRSKDLMRNPRWNSISVSLHHYDSTKLSELSGVHIPEAFLDFDGIDVNKVNISCNLIRGYIDCARETHRLLDFTLELGIPRLGLVSLMKINEFCRSRYVDFEDIHLDSIPRVYFIRSMSRGTDCRCSNFLYNHGLKILEIYSRNYMNPDYCESALVYDGVVLRQGFREHTENLII